MKIGGSLPLSIPEATSLSLFKRYSDRDMKFIRSYIGGLPPIQYIREKRLEYLSSLPTLYGLNKLTKIWTRRGFGRQVVSSKQGRDTDCVCLNPREALTAHLNRLEAQRLWPLSRKFHQSRMLTAEVQSLLYHPLILEVEQLNVCLKF